MTITKITHHFKRGEIMGDEIKNDIKVLKQYVDQLHSNNVTIADNYRKVKNDLKMAVFLLSLISGSVGYFLIKLVMGDL